MYRPQTVPTDPNSLVRFLEMELRSIAEAVNLPDKYVAAQFRNKDSDANRRGKAGGRSVWDSTSKKPVWPTGSSAEATWIFGDGTVAYSPE